VDKDEAIKLAYEVLQYIHEGALTQGAHTGISWRDVAIRAKPALTAIEEALAQSKHTPTLGVMVANHEQQIKDIMAHLLELKPMNMQQRYEAQILKSREDTLSAARVYKRDQWYGLTKTQVKLLREGVHEESIKTGDSVDWIFYTHIHEALKEKNK